MPRLETTIKRFIGHSSETKPRVGVTLEDGTTIKNENDLPPGSSFLEEDTGIIYRWTGQVWASTGIDNEVVGSLLKQILAHMKADRFERQTGFPAEVL